MPRTCEAFSFIGYVQGMSDYMSVLLYVLGNEVDAFWCFVGLMHRHRVRRHFELNQAHIRRELMQLSELLAAYNPELFRYLGTSKC